jgi:hypothetical protein
MRPADSVTGRCGDVADQGRICATAQAIVQIR